MTFTSWLTASLSTVALLLCSCASQAPARVYTAPSVAPVKQKITEAKEHIVTVRETVTQLDKECEKKLPGWQKAYDTTRDELNKAYLAAQAASDRADLLQKENDTLAQNATKESQQRANAQKALGDLSKQVNAYWGLGAFAYGTKVLLRHLFILAIVGAGLALAVFVLSLFFPVIGVGISVVIGFLKRIFSRFRGG